MANEDKKILVILDAHALIHRAYHALPSFTSASGEPMGAVYGVSSILIKLVRDLKPTHLVAAFDREEPTFRRIAFENYKGTRKKTDDELVPQFNKTRKLFKDLGISILDSPGFEADDIIGTLAEKLKRTKNLSIVIASGDMDTLQLVSGAKVTVYTMRKKLDDVIVYDEKRVNDRFGFGPEHITDYKGLKGDPSDNIAGVKGIGEKTATLLIRHYGSVENMYKELKKEKKHPKWLKERTLNLLLENEEEALFSKELATICTDAPIEISLDAFKFSEIPYDAAARAFRELHFPSLINRLNAERAGGKTPAESEEKEKSVSWGTLEEKTRAGDRIAVFEDGDSMRVGRFLFAKGEAPAFKKKLENFLKNKTVVAYDAKSASRALGFRIPCAFDLKLAALVCAPDRKYFSMTDVSKYYGIARNKEPCEEALLLSDFLAKKLKKEKLENIFYNFEMPLWHILYLMESTGISVDESWLTKLGREMEHELEVLGRDIWECAGEEFDIASPKQLSRILFEKLQLSAKGIKKTSTKAISTRHSELLKLQGEHPIIAKLLRHREVSKLLSTYVSVLPALVDKRDGRIHTTFEQIGTATGRFSSNNPNLQNIPIKTELGRQTRGAFVSERGFELVSFDYSQLELRIAASLSGDKKLAEAFIGGEDVHARTAAEMFHVDARMVSAEQRRRAKTINFGILYGMGARALAAGMGVSADEARAYLDEYLLEFPGIAEYRERTIRAGRKNGYVETLFGRKRYLPNLNADFEYVRSEAERMAVNAPIQGTAADMLKRAMIEIERELGLGGKGSDVRMLLQVHDELLFEIKKDKIRSVPAKIKAIMERVPELDVPIVVDIKAGANWRDMNAL